MDLPASVRPWEPRIRQGLSVERLQSDFVANASHELKSPVAAILALAAALRTAINDDPEAAKRFTAKLEREAERLGRLASDLLDLSRIESGMAERSTVELDCIVLAEAERLRSTAAGLGLRLQVEVSERMTVQGSASDLAVLIHNLLDNAMRHTPEGGTVTVTACGADGWAELTVRDTGAGIPDHEIERVFDRFYRAETARSAHAGGTGLGLAIVRKVADAHGGSVSVRNVPGSGAAFTVRLPLLEQPRGVGAVPTLRRVEPIFEIVSEGTH